MKESNVTTDHKPTEDDNTITLRLIEHGERTITVDRAEYEAAKAANELDHYLDVWASDVDTDTVVVEPDGTEFNPYR
jgi:hypothetical protein